MLAQAMRTGGAENAIDANRKIDDAISAPIAGIAPMRDLNAGNHFSFRRRNHLVGF
jgi:hypothetical protein